MSQDLQQEPGTTGWRDREPARACSACGGDVLADPTEAGLNCVRCGQWHLLCGDCTPANLSEYSRDSAWMCPDCRAKRPDA